MRILIAVCLFIAVLAGCSSAPAESPSVIPPDRTEPTAASSAATSSATQPPVSVPSVPATAPTDVPEPPPDPMQQLLETMSDAEKAGQLFFIRHRATTADDDIELRHVGGFILFAADIRNETPDTLRSRLAGYQKKSAHPLLIGTDEEGGTVNRVSSFPAFRDTPFLSPQALYQRGGLENIATDAAEKSAFLLSLGINVNLAPVCDISTDKLDYIYRRTLGQDATATSTYAETVVRAMQTAGIGSVLKHFPGYGGSADTHKDIVTDSRPLSVFLENDLLPFKAGAQAGAGAVLVSHNIVTSIDDESPASLSPAVYRLLREQLGDTIVAMTDDLAMAAIAGRTGGENPAVAALMAGADLVITSDFEADYTAILNAVRDDRISSARLDEAVLRILRLKQSLGLFE